MNGNKELVYPIHHSKNTCKENTFYIQQRHDNLESINQTQS